MKSVWKIIFLIFISLFAFNIYAEEVNIEENITETPEDKTIIVEDNSKDEVNQQEESNGDIKEAVEEEKNTGDITKEETVEEEPKAEELTTEKESNNELTHENQNEVVSNDELTQENQNEVTSNDENNDSESHQYKLLKVMVKISKIDEDKNPLSGAVLQVIDSKGNVIEEWTSTSEEKIIYLPDGTYTLHELSAPEGYEIADDKEFVIKVELPEVDAGVDFNKEPCPHYGGTPLYYVMIEGKKQEVYCINQNWEVPDEESTYDGEILNPNSIRDFTKQTVPVDASNKKEKIDISDQELTDQQLYDKILDIIYHRHKAEKLYNDLSIPEIRLVTESALKNFTNAGLTEAVIAYRKSTNTTYFPLDVEGVLYDERSNGDIFYLRHQYRDYVYTPNVELGKNIFDIRVGEGNSFGQMFAYHWSVSNHNADENAEVRNKIARYYELYQYLMSDEDSHPDDMNIFIYSTKTEYSGANPNADYAYQNLLGITGYFEDIKEQEELEIKLENKYSTEKRNIHVSKVWDDTNDEDEIRPKSIKVYLLANGEKTQEVTLSEDNNWEASFENLNVYEKGKKIEYTISEETIEFYEVDIKENEEGFIITNYHKSWPKGDGDEPKDDNPKTGDNIATNVVMLIASILGLASGIIYLIKNKTSYC